MLNRNKKFKSENEAIRWMYGDALRPFVSPYKLSLTILFYAYVEYLISKNNAPEDMDLKSILKYYVFDECQELDSVLLNFLGGAVWERARKQLPKNLVKPEKLKAFILHESKIFYSIEESSMHTPDSIVSLAKRILNIQPKETVSDPCSGAGDFILSAYNDQPKADYYGNDINWDRRAIAVIRRNVLMDITCNMDALREEKISVSEEGVNNLYNNRIYFDYGDIFHYMWKLGNRSWDKIFIDPPLGVRIETEQKKAEIEHAFEIACSRSLYTELPIAMAAFMHLSKNGKAVCILTESSCATGNSSFRMARHYLLENKMVEAVITLPAKLKEESNNSFMMMVLSHENEKVKMVDASHFYTKGRRQNELSPQNIEDIMNAYQNEGPHSKFIDTETILGRDDVSLYPDDYLAKEIKIPNGIKFKDVIKDLYRGASISAMELDKLQSQVPTRFSYVRLQDIQDGRLNSELPYLTKIDEKYKKFLLKNGDLIIAKSGSPFRTAVAKVEEEQEIFAAGNFYIVELDAEKINPYYLQAFFSSNLGQNVLGSAAKGSVIPLIAKSALMDIMVPCPSKDKQKEVADQYLALGDEIEIYQRRIEETKKNVSNLFDDPED